MSYLRYTIEKRTTRYDKRVQVYYVLTHETLPNVYNFHHCYVSEDFTDIVSECSMLHVAGNYKRVKKL